jgi:hypothetical protein
MPRDPMLQYAHVIARAWKEPAFKQLLISDPHAAWAEEGVTLPAGLRVRVLEDTETVVHFVLPQKFSEDVPKDIQGRTHHVALAVLCNSVLCDGGKKKPKRRRGAPKPRKPRKPRKPGKRKSANGNKRRKRK